MKTKMRIKLATDMLMTILLILLMAYQVTGEYLHEWLGAGMMAAFILHHILNLRWYGSLFKGKYHALRIFKTIINFLMLADMLALVYSGIIISRHIFATLPVRGSMALARVTHLSGSYWGLILMGIHLGLHWNMVTGNLRKKRQKNQYRAVLWLFRLAAVLIAGYGAVTFYRADIVSYLLIKTEFAFLDFEKNAFLVLTEYIAMMGLWIFLSYYAAKAVADYQQKKRHGYKE